MRDTDLSRDIAKRFAVLYAGGILARRAGLVGWDGKELLQAIRKCYVKARAMLPDDGELLRTGLEILTQKLAGLLVISSSNMTQFNRKRCDALDGYRQILSDPISYTIKRQVFDELFISVPQKALVEAWLLDNGRLARSVSKNPNVRIAVAKEQHIWPDGERRRSLEIYVASKSKILK